MNVLVLVMVSLSAVHNLERRPRCHRGLSFREPIIMWMLRECGVVIVLWTVPFWFVLPMYPTSCRGSHHHILDGGPHCLSVSWMELLELRTVRTLSWKSTAVWCRESDQPVIDSPHPSWAPFLGCLLVASAPYDSSCRQPGFPDPLGQTVPFWSRRGRLAPYRFLRDASWCLTHWSINDNGADEPWIKLCDSMVPYLARFSDKGTCMLAAPDQDYTLPTTRAPGSFHPIWPMIKDEYG